MSGPTFDFINEAVGTLRAVLGEPWRATDSHSPLSCCIRTLQRYLKVSLVREYCSDLQNNNPELKPVLVGFAGF